MFLFGNFNSNNLRENKIDMFIRVFFLEQLQSLLQNLDEIHCTIAWCVKKQNKTKQKNKQNKKTGPPERKVSY